MNDMFLATLALIFAIIIVIIMILGGLFGFIAIGPSEEKYAPVTKGGLLLDIVEKRLTSRKAKHMCRIFPRMARAGHIREWKKMLDAQILEDEEIPPSDKHALLKMLEDYLLTMK